jgi:hypothetical protein
MRMTVQSDPDSIPLGIGYYTGQPIAAAYGIPAVVLADAVEAEQTEERVAELYEGPDRGNRAVRRLRLGGARRLRRGA